MTIASDNVFPKVILEEGAAPATPSSGQVKVYAKTDGLVYSKDDAGVETGPFGGSGVADIVDIPTAETDTSLVLAPDGAGGVEFRAEAGGGGGGGLVLLESHTASASSSLDFTTRNAAGQSGATIQSDYKVYEIVLRDVLPAAGARSLGFRVSTDGGSTYDSTSGHYFTKNIAAGGGVGLDTPGTDAHWLTYSGNNVSNNAAEGVSGTIRLYMPVTGSGYPKVIGQVGYYDGSTFTIMVINSRYLTAGAALNALRFIFSSSTNITSGEILIFGVGA